MPRKFISLMLFAILVTSCTVIGPARFWTSYHKELIEKHDSDQGPWGGHRNIHWKSNSEKKIKTTEFLNHAKRNGWELTDSLLLASISLQYDRNKIGDYMYDLIRETVLHEWKLKDVNMIYVFKTGWISVEPGNFRETEKNGFIGISNDRKALFVFHKWGE